MYFRSNIYINSIISAFHIFYFILLTFSSVASENKPIACKFLVSDVYKGETTSEKTFVVPSTVASEETNIQHASETNLKYKVDVKNSNENVIATYQIYL